MRELYEKPEPRSKGFVFGEKEFLEKLGLQGEGGWPVRVNTGYPDNGHVTVYLYPFNDKWPEDENKIRTV